MEAVYTVKQRNIEIPFKEKIKIWCFGDVHRFTKSCDEDRWKWFLQKAKASHDDNTYYLGLGDYMDLASTKERRVLNSPELHDQTKADFDLIIQKRNRAFVQELSFMKGHILGLIEGNHTWLFQNGKSSTEDLCERLGTEYLGWLTHFTLHFDFINHGSRMNIHIVASHGKAGGKTSGNTINQVDDLRRIFPIADVYIMGHDHQRAARPESVLFPIIDRMHGGIVKMKQKRQFLCRSGSFKKAYTEGYSAYEVGRLLKPADLGALLIEISFHRDHSDGEYIIPDIVAII